MSKYHSENEVLKALNIKDFSQIDSKNFMEFAKLFKDIDPEVGKMILTMIPEFIAIVKDVLDSYEHSYDRSVDAIEKIQTDYHEFISKIVDILSMMSESSEASTEDKAKIIDALLIIEERRAHYDEEVRAAIKEEREEHHKHVGQVITAILSTLSLVVVVAIGLSGGGERH